MYGDHQELLAAAQSPLLTEHFLSPSSSSAFWSSSSSSVVEENVKREQIETGSPTTSRSVITHCRRRIHCCTVGCEPASACQVVFERRPARQDKAGVSRWPWVTLAHSCYPGNPVTQPTLTNPQIQTFTYLQIQTIGGQASGVFWQKFWSSPNNSENCDTFWNLVSFDTFLVQAWSRPARIWTR